MTTPDLEALGALTRDYATFQARKSALAMVRGWKEHREYLAILRALPQEP